ncbi:GAF domain-containing protein [Sphingomonas sp. CGMCC 1.13654]|uniref:GAF domain-containing protein n=1 Tax=Sphingomonas chungangi TaxID=2683589 RepID=A0A838LDE3_9SPHN|nr:GAF domain-containing protein [Sphingomonas chungangi]MBA2936156.1 GAF domain-containing protein [Sphingomonas chungangi]MVW55542.1 GAF domain-containing protein [Sphingomonas chungangi]
MTIYYTPANRPADEDERQRAVDESGFLEAAGDPTLDAIVHEAAKLFGTPIAAISIVDHERQYFPVGIGLDASETPRAASFCAHAMLDCRKPMCVTDATADARFAGNPLVLSGPDIRFYLGMPLVSGSGQPLGALCVIDRERREVPDQARLDAMAALARKAMDRVHALKH